MTTPNVEVKANRFLKTKIKKKTKFMDQDIEINKLTVNEVFGIQEKAKNATETATEEANFELLVYVCKTGAPELTELEDEDFKLFPMGELSDLSQTIMEYSGLGKQKN